MKKSVKVFLLVVLLLIILILIGPIYKNLKVEAYAHENEIGRYLEFEGNKYYILKDVAQNYIDNKVLYEDDS